MLRTQTLLSQLYVERIAALAPEPLERVSSGVLSARKGEIDRECYIERGRERKKDREGEGIDTEKIKKERERKNMSENEGREKDRERYTESGRDRERERGLKSWGSQR